MSIILRHTRDITIKDMNGGQVMTPWEKPRIKRILELFNGHVTEVKQITIQRSTNNEKSEEICR